MNDPAEAMKKYVEVSKKDFGPNHGPGSNVALTDSELKLDAGRTYEGNGTYKVQFRKDEGKSAYDAAEKAHIDAAKPVESRTDQALNDPVPASHPELPKPERAAAGEDLIPEMVLDKSDLRRLAIQRSEEAKIVADTLGLNTVEAHTKRESIALDAESDAKRNAWVQKAQLEPAEIPVKGNRVESDEVFTAEKRDVQPIVPPEVDQKYLQVGSKFYYPKTENVAFEDKGNKLETQSKSEAVAESMVRTAQARGWDEIKVSGSETFRREVWLEAASRNMEVKGYLPSDIDLAVLAKRQHKSAHAKAADQGGEDFRARENEAAVRQPDRPVPGEANVGVSTAGSADFRARENTAQTSQPAQALQPSAEQTLNSKRAETIKRELSPEAGTQTHPELAGSYAIAAAIDKKAEADGLSPEARSIVAARARQNIANSIERGELPQARRIETVEVKKTVEEERGVAR